MPGTVFDMFEIQDDSILEENWPKCVSLTLLICCMKVSKFQKI
jgi:hypothetical protein